MKKTTASLPRVESPAPPMPSMRPPRLDASEFTPPRAHPLEAIFRDAVDQAQRGKGEERHGQGKEFMRQTWLETANAHGPAFLTGQVEKKLRESLAMPYSQRRSERLGALVYLAMSIIKDDIDQGCGPKP